MTPKSPPLFPELSAINTCFDLKVVLIDFLEATKMIFTLHLTHVRCVDVDDDDVDVDDDDFE